MNAFINLSLQEPRIISSDLKTRIRLIILVINVFFFSPTLHSAIINQSDKSSIISLKILGINDFHGQISAGRFVEKEPVGGAAVLSSYLKVAQAGMEQQTIIAIIGDHVGASTPVSGLLDDQPSILFTNSLGNDHCSPLGRMDPECNLVATVGNHEFDHGQQALFDLIYGTPKPPKDNWISLPFYPGATYPYLSANIVDAKTQQPVFPPYVIKLIDGVRVAFIGAILKDAAEMMFPDHAEGIAFLDETSAINQYIPEIKAMGADIIIVLIHEGGSQLPYEGKTKPNTYAEGNIVGIVNQLDDAVDVVMGGHTHQFLNAYLSNQHGKSILVTQANSYSASFAEVDIDYDKVTHQIKNKSAQIITTYSNRWPGTVPDDTVKQIVDLAESAVNPIIQSKIGLLEHTLSREQNEDGESNLGNLIADAFKTVMQTDIGIINPHGIRDDLQAGCVTWGNVYAVQPFSNHIVAINLTGSDIYALLEQQWTKSYPNMLQISGITYTYDQTKPIGHRIVEVLLQGVTLQKDKIYSVATTDFLASDGIMKKAPLIKMGDNDHETLVKYIKNLSQPFFVSIEGRIRKVIK